MDTVLIELTNNKALRLLKELEDLHIIRPLKRNVEPDHFVIAEDSAVYTASRRKASDYKGILSSDPADKMQSYVQQSRAEWQQPI